MMDSFERKTLKPKVGEYWYHRNGFLAEITDTIRHFSCQFKVDGALFSCDYEDLISKWEPNLFWRLLGYK